MLPLRAPNLFCLAFLLPAILLPATLFLAGCDSQLEAVLEGAGERPTPEATTGETGQGNAPVPDGGHLYCLTNIGHRLVAFSLAEQRPLTETLRTVALDPIGPWFADGVGYYLSRVAASGAGANALIAFDPRSLAELGRVAFPGNSNPAALLLLPDAGLAWVALKGSTFDNFATNGIAVVRLADLQETAFFDLSAVTLEGLEEPLSSLVGFFHDPANGNCAAGAGCIYAVVNNWRNRVREGWLLVLEPRGEEPPTLVEAVALGLNPMETLLLDDERELWVVNNGGYAEYGGEPGTLQVLDARTLGDGITGNETVAEVDFATVGSGSVGSGSVGSGSANSGDDPTAIFPFSAGTAWVTVYPDQPALAIDLTANALATQSPALPAVTGPLITISGGGPPEVYAGAVYAGIGGYGAAGLALLDPSSGEITSEFDLEAGAGPVSCAEFTPL